MARRRRRTTLAWGAVVAVAVAWLVSLAAVISVGRRDEARTADVVVVLGAAQYVGRPSPVLRARLDHAIALWRRGLAPRIMLTGGTGVGDTTSEAAVGRNYAMRAGIPDSAILLETRGRTTSESMHAVAAVMRAHGLRTAVFVSDPFHMLRLRILARRAGIVVYTSPTGTSPISANREKAWTYMVTESFKVPFSYLFARGGQ